jgi:hypothetical protein
MSPRIGAFIVLLCVAVTSLVAASASGQTDPYRPTCNVNVNRTSGTTWHFDGACSGTDLAIGPLTVYVSISVPGTWGVGGAGSSTMVAQSGTGEPAVLSLSASGDVGVNIFCIPPGQYTAQISWSVDYSSCTGGVCGGDPSRIYHSSAVGDLGTVAAPLEAADVGATLQVAVDPTAHDGFTPNVSIAYTFGTYTNSNYILIFGATSQVAQRFWLSGSGTWNLSLLPGSYTVHAVVCSAIPAAIATFTIPLPQTQNGAVPHFDFPDLSGIGGGTCTTPPCDNRILASIAPWDHYESRYQEPSPTPGTVRFKVRGTILDYVTRQPKTGTVYLRLDDPDDTAPYVVAAGDAHSPNVGACATFAGSTPGTACQAAFAVQADANGRFEATVTAPIPVAGAAHATAAAGNNYQITASADPAFPCVGLNPCAKSAVFTLWKRVYVEEEHMFRNGAFIVARAPAKTSEIPVSSDAPFRSLTPGVSRLRLVHANTGAPGDSFYADTVTFQAIAQDGAGGWIVRILGSLPRAYGETLPAGTRPPVNGLLRDGVGVLQDGTYDPNTVYTSQLLESAFVELQPVPPLAVTETPYAREIPLWYMPYYSSRWLQRRATTAPASALSVPAADNVFHRIGIAQMPLVQPSPPKTDWGAELGVTVVGGGIHYSAINVQRITDLAAGIVRDRNGKRVGPQYRDLPAVTLNGETTAHETAHFWVPRGGSDGHGHCIHTRWQRDGLNCLMHEEYTGRGLADGLVDLHYENHGGDSEYMKIRWAPDPVPQF